MKKCSTCLKEKSLDNFQPKSDSKDGKRGQCKECYMTKQRSYYHTEHGRKVKNNINKQWLSRNKKKMNTAVLENNNRYADTLHDLYIIKRIKGATKSILTSAEIRKHPKLIEAVRANLILKRKIRDL